MTRHFEHLAKFVSVFGNDNEHEVHTDSDDNHMLIRRMLIKCADVSNPARPYRFCAEWAERYVDIWIFAQICSHSLINSHFFLAFSILFFSFFICQTTELPKNILHKQMKKNVLVYQL